MCTCVLSCFSCVRLFATLWTVGCRTPLSMGLFSQEYRSGLPCPPPGNHSQPRDRTCVSCGSCSGSGLFTTNATWEACDNTTLCLLSILLSFSSAIPILENCAQLKTLLASLRNSLEWSFSPVAFLSDGLMEKQSSFYH